MTIQHGGWKELDYYVGFLIGDFCCSEGRYDFAPDRVANELASYVSSIAVQNVQSHLVKVTQF